MENLIPIHVPSIGESDIDLVVKALKSTFVSGDGPICRELEKEIENYLGVGSLFLNSATAGLELAFRAKKFKPECEVIVPNFTFTSTALGPMYNNLKIVLADVQSDTGNLDPSKLEKYVTDKTVAIVPVDYAGVPCDIEKIEEFARSYDLYTVHDTAQSFGSKFKGKLTGNFFDLSTFSLHGTKNFTSGEGGILSCKDREFLNRLKILRDKGTDKNKFLSDDQTRGYYEYLEIGNSYVQSNICAALGLSQLSQVDSFNNKRRSIAKKYNSAFRDLENFKTIRIPEHTEHNWHLYGVIVPNNKRFELIDELRTYNIHANIHYTPLHRNQLFKSYSSDKEMSGSMRFYSQLVRIPIYPALSDNQVDFIIEKFTNSWKKIVLG